jgi:NAD(P)-dependent dehydrogenase (short-subunit alcohol dehydrogenase family)
MSLDSSLRGKVAIISASDSGIGAQIARELSTLGASIVINYPFPSTASRAQAVVSSLSTPSIAVEADLSTTTGPQALIAAAVARFGTIDILVNNAWSGGALTRVQNKTDELLANAFAVGYYGPFWAMQAAYPTMKAQHYGRIISLCSLNGVNAHIGSTEYNSAKEALRALTRTAAREWAPDGIVANIICPGAKSAAFERIIQTNPEIEASADAANPMGRLGDPEDDIAPVAVFLASEGARYLTGNTLFVDGGSHINGSTWAPVLPE